MTTIYTDTTCLDCDRTTSIADDEPPENQRCIAHWVEYLKEKP